MKTINKYKIITIFFIGVIYISSCSPSKSNIEKNAYSALLNDKITENTHRWFYFTESGYKEIIHPTRVAKKETKPWTEALRITDSAIINDTAYICVNKLGLLVAPIQTGIQKEGIASKTYLVKNEKLFTPYTVESLYTINNTLFFNFLRNSSFNKNDSSLKKNTPILIQFEDDKNAFAPRVFKNDIIPQETSDIFLDLNINTLKYIEHDKLTLWNAQFKSNTAQKTTFKYVEFTTNWKESKKPSIISKEIIEANFRKKTTPLSFSKAPMQLQKLLKGLPPKFSFYIHNVKMASKKTTTYVQNMNTKSSLQAYSITLESCTLAVFSDGTTYFAGKLPLKSVVENGNTIAFKLPNLPSKYVYSSSILSGSNLFVGWEEKDFYKTGRTGFLVINLETVLYGGRK